MIFQLNLAAIAAIAGQAAWKKAKPVILSLEMSFFYLYWAS